MSHKPLHDTAVHVAFCTAADWTPNCMKVAVQSGALCVLSYVVHIVRDSHAQTHTVSSYAVQPAVQQIHNPSYKLIYATVHVIAWLVIDGSSSRYACYRAWQLPSQHLCLLHLLTKHLCLCLCLCMTPRLHG